MPAKLIVSFSSFIFKKEVDYIIKPATRTLGMYIIYQTFTVPA